ncbi:GrpB family protein [Catenulispora pinisilvae]|uniref:GrpB family protein n=1 Tax=Catenulispora pinisilvae TaxID=2705253 RepID=UPI001892143B|nr:GrpB family protein [Catenulispora pinisilvae]
MSKPVEVEDYDPRWPEVYAMLSEPLYSALSGIAQRIEHVGSTSVPGLAAKPIIDLTVVIGTRDDLPAAINALRAIGYHHEGDLGIPGREAFTTPPGAPSHHLYVCAKNSPQLAQQLMFRDFLRAHPDIALAYATLKRSLAERFTYDRSAYTAAKSAFIEQTLTKATDLTQSGDSGVPNDAPQ